MKSTNFFTSDTISKRSSYKRFYNGLSQYLNQFSAKKFFNHDNLNTEWLSAINEINNYYINNLFDSVHFESVVILNNLFNHAMDTLVKLAESKSDVLNKKLKTENKITDDFLYKEIEKNKYFTGFQAYAFENFLKNSKEKCMDYLVNEQNIPEDFSAIKKLIKIYDILASIQKQFDLSNFSIVLHSIIFAYQEELAVLKLLNLQEENFKQFKEYCNEEMTAALVKQREGEEITFLYEDYDNKLRTAYDNKVKEIEEEFNTTLREIKRGLSQFKDATIAFFKQKKDKDIPFSYDTLPKIDENFSRLTKYGNGIIAALKQKENKDALPQAEEWFANFSFHHAFYLLARNHRELLDRVQIYNLIRCNFINRLNDFQLLLLHESPLSLPITDSLSLDENLALATFEIKKLKLEMKCYEAIHLVYELIEKYVQGRHLSQIGREIKEEEISLESSGQIFKDELLQEDSLSKIDRESEDEPILWSNKRQIFKDKLLRDDRLNKIARKIDQKQRQLMRERFIPDEQSTWSSVFEKEMTKKRCDLQSSIEKWKDFKLDRCTIPTENNLKQSDLDTRVSILDGALQLAMMKDSTSFEETKTHYQCCIENLKVRLAEKILIKNSFITEKELKLITRQKEEKGESLDEEIAKYQRRVEELSKPSFNDNSRRIFSSSAVLFNNSTPPQKDAHEAQLTQDNKGRRFIEAGLD